MDHYGIMIMWIIYLLSWITNGKFMTTVKKNGTKYDGK